MENRINRKEFERLISKLYFEIENNLIDNLFNNKYQKLENLSIKVDLNKLDDDFIEKYKRIKEFQKERDIPGFNFSYP